MAAAQINARQLRVFCTAAFVRMYCDGMVGPEGLEPPTKAL